MKIDQQGAPGTAVSNPTVRPAGRARGAGALTTLAVTLTEPGSGRVLAREPVGWPDLRDCLGELWMRRVLRRGHPDRVPEPGSVIVRPCTGTPGPDRFIMTARCGEEEVAAEFGIDALGLTAHRAAVRLVAAGELAPEDTYYVCLATAGEQNDASPDAFSVVGQAPSEPFRHFALDLPRILDGTRRMDEPYAVEEDFPIVFLRSAWEAAERYSRRGAAEADPVETGCALVGVPVSCRTTGEFGLVVVDALEARHADREPFSLAFTAASWAFIQGVLRRRRDQVSTRMHRLAGTAHGHNFTPNPGGGKCSVCPLRAHCGFSNVGPSIADGNFMNAVFCGLPWQVALIFGQTARGDLDSGLFALRGGVLSRRAYYLVDEQQLEPALRDRLGLLKRGEEPWEQQDV